MPLVIFVLREDLRADERLLAAPLIEQSVGAEILHTGLRIGRMVFGPDIAVLPGDTADGHVRRHLVHDPDQPRPDNRAFGVEQRDQPAALLRLGRSAGDFIPGSVVVKPRKQLCVGGPDPVRRNALHIRAVGAPRRKRTGFTRPDHDRIRPGRPLHDGHLLRFDALHLGEDGQRRAARTHALAVVGQQQFHDRTFRPFGLRHGAPVGRALDFPCHGCTQVQGRFAPGAVDGYIGAVLRQHEDRLELLLRHGHGVLLFARGVKTHRGRALLGQETLVDRQNDLLRVRTFSDVGAAPIVVAGDRPRRIGRDFKDAAPSEHIERHVILEQ